MAVERLKNLQLQALRAVVKPDDEALFRFVCRWYSEKFCTPLMEVYDLPIDFVLQHYFEDQYESMTVEERHAKAMELLESQEQRQERLRREEAEIADQLAVMTGHKKLENEIKDRAPSALQQQVAGLFNKFKKKVQPVTPEDPKVKEMIEDMGEVEALDEPESDLPQPPPIDEPDLEFSFSESDFGDLETLAPPKSKE